jgi:endonuclease/exonuclease/phosphatase family metal-dependent hydrolase
MRLLTVLLVLCGCSSVWGQSRPSESDAAGELRVMSFNIRYGTAPDGEDHWDKRHDLVFEVIRTHRPDVVGLQEALRFQLDAIREALPIYDEIGVGRDNGQDKGEYNTILYRKDRLKVLESGNFWYSDTPSVPGSKHWGNNLPRICTWAHLELRDASQKRFYFFNTHLDHQSQPSRERSARLLAERIAGRKTADPVVVTGDFNSGEDNPAIRYLVSREGSGRTGAQNDHQLTLIDTFRRLHPDVKEAGTFNGFKGKRTGDKIDYIMVTPEVRVLRAEIVRDNRNGRYPSDHFPLTATIKIGNE